QAGLRISDRCACLVEHRRLLAEHAAGGAELVQQIADLRALRIGQASVAEQQQGRARREHRDAFVPPVILAVEQAFLRTSVRMSTDARGGLWIDNPLLVLSLLSLFWVLLASLHGEPWSGRHGHPG